LFCLSKYAGGYFGDQPFSARLYSFDPFAKRGSWIKHVFVKKPKVIFCYTSNVTGLTLNRDSLAASSPEKSDADSMKIQVSTVGWDHEGDTLAYIYEVSGGKIIGEGSNVNWDLSNVKPGQYMITAWADDGCGKCGKSLTRIVTETPNPK
jgi:hypothetical protein